jgi:hypothetical protein
MAHLYKVRLDDGRVLSPGEWSSAKPLYSTVEFATGSVPVLTAYSYAKGGVVPGSASQRQATYNDTNLDGEGGRLPEYEEIIAYSLSIELFTVGAEAADALPPCDAPDVSALNMARMQRDVLIITRIASVKEYTRQPLGWFPAGSGAQQWNSGARSDAAPTTGYLAGNNGGPNPCDMRQLASPLYIAGGETFGVDFKPAPGEVTDLALAAGARIRCRVFFEGYRRLPVA